MTQSPEDVLAATRWIDSLRFDRDAAIARAEKAEGERDAARAELAALREKPAAELRTVPFSEVPVGAVFDVATVTRYTKASRARADSAYGEDEYCHFGGDALVTIVVAPPAAEPKPEPKSDWRERFDSIRYEMRGHAREWCETALLALRDGIDEALRLRGGK